jgi:hypothetical protein
MEMGEVGAALLGQTETLALTAPDRARVLDHVVAVDALATAALARGETQAAEERRQQWDDLRAAEAHEPAPVLSDRLQEQLQRFKAAGGRLLVHGGAPKAGSTAMQHVFRRETERLLRHGICYPSNTSAPGEPSHRWLIVGLALRRVDVIESELGAAIEEALEVGATTVLLSTEGLYYYWSRDQAWAGPWLRSLAAAVTVDVWFVLREPMSFTAALYQEFMRSRWIWPMSKGQPFPPSEAIRRPGLLRRLDYDAAIGWWEAVVGRERVRVDVYVPALAPVVREALGVPDLAWDEDRANASLSGYGCQLLVLLNTFRLPLDVREQIIEHVSAIDAIAKAALGPQHILSDEEASYVREQARPSIERLVSRRPELSPLLG